MTFTARFSNMVDHIEDFVLADAVEDVLGKELRQDASGYDTENLTADEQNAINDALSQVEANEAIRKRWAAYDSVRDVEDMAYVDVAGERVEMPQEARVSSRTFDEVQESFMAAAKTALVHELKASMGARE